MATLDTQPTTESLLRQQEGLRQVIESISSELELRPLLTEIVRRACELLGAARGSVGLVDEDRGVMRTEAIWQMPPEELGAEMASGKGLAGQVMSSGRAVVIDRYGDLPHASLPGVAEDVVVGVPISWRGDLIGFLGIGADPPHRFSPADVELLNLLARHAAIAITNARLLEREKRRAIRLATISRVGQLITGSLSLEEILRTAVEAIHDQLPSTSAGLLLVSQHDPRTLVLVDRRGHPSTAVVGKYTQSIDQGIVGAAARSREPILVPDVTQDPRYHDFPGAQDTGTRSELAIPLTVGDRLLGVLNIESHEILGEDDVEGLKIVGDQLGAAIENARLFAQLERSAESQRRLAVLEERNRLARELHDSVNQLLFSASLIAQSLGASFRKDPEEGDRRVERLLELSQAARAEMRNLLTELAPPRSEGETARASSRDELLSSGLAVTLGHHLERVAPSRLQVRLDTGHYESATMEIEEALLRIAQEAFNNVIKHSQATDVGVRLSTASDGSRLEIEDDGVGFSSSIGDADSPAPGDEGRSGLGLGTMNERARAVGGHLRIDSRPGRGTRVSVTIPPARVEEAER